MNRKPELALLYRIAQRYYIDKLPQSQIAEMENISRSQISRLLDKAEQMGIVSIRVQLPEQPDLQALGAAICSGLKLKEVLVASLDKDTSDGTPDKEAIAAHAAPYLSSVFRNAKTVGIDWGRTMYETSLLLPYRRASHDTLFVPLIGISGVNEPCLQINTIVDRMAEKHRAGSYLDRKSVV